MPFDLSTAKPVKGGFDVSTAREYQEPSVGVPEMLRRPQLTPEQIRAEAEAEAVRLRDEAMRAQYDELSAPEKLAVGFGRGAESLMQFIQQLGASGQSPRMSEVGDIPAEQKDRLSKLINEAAESERTYQMGTPDGVLAGLGRFGFDVASTAIPGAQVSKVSGVQRIASPLLRAGAEGGVLGATAAAMQPVTEGSADEFATEKLSQILQGGTLGAGAGAGLNLLGKGLGFMLSPRATAVNVANEPKGVIAESILGKTDDEFLKRSEELARETGVELTPPMKTGAKLGVALENAARQNAFTAEQMLAKDEKITQQTIKYIDNIMAGVSNKTQTPETAGEAVQNALREATKKMIAERKTLGDKMYGALRDSGVKVRYTNLADELQKIIDESEGAIGDTSRKAAAQARAKLKLITSKGSDLETGVDAFLNPITRGGEKAGVKEFPIDAALKSRSEFSGAAGGVGEIFRDLDTASQRRYAARLLGAIEKDFADAEVSETTGLLKKANDTYKAYSDRISQVKKTYLSKFLGEELANDVDGLTMQTVAPETVAAKVQKLQPTEARQLRAFLSKHDPDANDAIRRVILQQAYDKMSDTSVSAGARALPDLGAFVREIKRNKSLNEWFSPEELKKLANVEDLVKRYGDKFGYNFSGTAAQSALLEIIKPGVDRALQLAILKKVAQQGSEALPTPSLGRLSPAAESARNAAAIIAGQSAAEPGSGAEQ